MRGRGLLAPHIVKAEQLRDKQSGLRNDRGAGYTERRSAAAVPCGSLRFTMWVLSSSMTRHWGSRADPLDGEHIGIHLRTGLEILRQSPKRRS